MKKALTVISIIVAFVAGILVTDIFNLDMLLKQNAKYDQKIIKELITEISEMATLQYKYTANASYDGGAKQAFGIDIPLTSKSMIVQYEGIIKLGSDLSGLDIKLDNNKAVITIPHSKILSHEIDQNEWKILDVNNGLFNRVTLQDNNEFIKVQKEKTEAKVNNGNLLKETDEKTSKQLANFLKLAYPDLEVEVVFS